MLLRSRCFAPLVAGLLAVIGPGIGEAQASGFNVERVRLRPKEDGLSGGLSVGVDFQAGNVNRFDLNTSASLAYHWHEHLAFLIGNSSFATRSKAIDGGSLDNLFAPDSRFINKAQVHLRYNYEIRPWAVAEIFNQVERDEFLLVESRVLLGVGPRFVPFDNGHFRLALGTAWMLEYEALAAERVVSPLPAQTLVHRWSSYLSLSYGEPDDRLRMRSTLYFQPRFDLVRDLRLFSESELDIVLVEPVSIKLFLRLRWDNAPSIYCRQAVALTGCPADDRVQLREVDIGIENAIAVSF